MFCPQCGTESSSGLQYCRTCGANLKVIGKALTLGEAIARSDRGPLPKIKEMMRSLKVDQVTEEISHALDQMNNEIVKSSNEHPHKPWWLQRREKTAAERREKQMVKGTVALFSGIGLTIFLYYLSAVLVLKLPPHVLEQIPFEVDPVVRVLWLVGFIPMLSGLGHIIAGLLIRRDSPRQIEPPSTPQLRNVSQTNQPSSITEHTTNILNHRV